MRQGDDLRERGIWVCENAREMERLLRKAESAASFRFALLEQLPEDIQTLLPLLPFRILTPSNVSSDLQGRILQVDQNKWKAIRSQPGEVDMVSLWEAWLGRWSGGRPVLHVYLDQRDDEEPTITWSRKAADFNGRVGRSAYVVIWCRGPNPHSNTDDVNRPCSNDVPIVWDRHAIVLRHLSSFTLPQGAWIYLDKMSDDFRAVFQPPFPEDGASWTFPMELLEAGLLRVVVADERVAEKAKEDVIRDETDALCLRLGIRNASRWFLALLGKIYIVTHMEVGGQRRPLHPAMEEELLVLRVDESGCGIEPGRDLAHFLVGRDVWGKVRLPDEFDMLIIHHGLVEGWARSKEEEEIEKFLNCLQESFPFVLVDSGRGIPPTIPKNVKFIPFSTLRQTLLGYRIAKYRLVRTAMTITRRREAP